MSCFACCFPCLLESTPTLKIESTNFKILDLLGEGGFSYVYLVQNARDPSKQYALKKLRCPYGNANFQQALGELEAYKEFDSPWIIRSIDSSVVQEPDGSKTLYILLPYYDRGSLQDLIDANSVNGDSITEDEALRLFCGICKGLVAMHRHQLKNEAYKMTAGTKKLGPGRGWGHGQVRSGASGASNAIDASVPTEDDPFLSPEERAGAGMAATELVESIPMAHRDIKPGNVMLSSDGSPVLCDLGSCAKARVHLTTRSQAVAEQEKTNELCTLAYRAPELLDIKVGDRLDEKVDIWSLGCTLYALLYGCSPFEREQLLNGANMTLAISSGTYSFPDEPQFSDELKGLVRYCLEVDPEKRPAIEDVLTKAEYLERGDQ